MFNRKGQITVFIIIGIAAVIGLGVFLYMRGVKLPEEAAIRPTIEDVPTQFKPLSDYVTGCLFLTAKDGLDRIGVHGGYTDPKDVGVYNPHAPTEGDGVEMFPGTGLVVPYWHHLNSDNTCHIDGSCSFETERPNLYRKDGDPSIEGILDKYVEEKLAACINDFSDFRGAGMEIVQLAQPKATSTVTEDSVAVLLKYPLQVRTGETTIDMDTYFVELPVHLKTIYNLATEIVNAQIRHFFAEAIFLTAQPLYSGLDSSLLPPKKATETGLSGSVIWIKHNVKKQVKSIIAGMTPLLHIIGTEDSDSIGGFEPDDERWAFVNRATVVPVDGIYPRISSNFVYLPIWDPYFELICVGGMGGGMCSAGSANINLLFINIGVHSYDIRYSISYPILVELRDKFAYNGRGFTFNFFLEANIRNNIALKPEYELPVAESPGLPSQFCDRVFWDSPNITVEVWDRKEWTPIQGSLISYECGKESCEIGTTGPDGKLTSQFPKCIGGRIGAMKQGYLTRRVRVSTETDQEKEGKIYLDPETTIDITAKKWQFLDVPGVGWTLSGDETVELNPFEEAIIILDRSQADGGEKFVTFAEYCTDARKQCDYKEKRIYPGTYNATVLFLTRKDISVPAYGVEFGETAPLMIGGLDNFEINVDERVYDSEELLMRIIAYGVDKIPEPTIDHISATGNLQLHQTLIQDRLGPHLLATGQR